MQRFPFSFDPKFRGFLRLAGIHPGNSEVVVSEDTFRARFGRFRVTTPMDNVTDASVTGDYHWWKAIGVRYSFSDGGATFGSNNDAGVCVRFRKPVPVYTRLLRHPGLTVTVEDPEGVVAAIDKYRGADDD